MEDEDIFVTIRFHDQIPVNARLHVANVLANYIDTSMATLPHETPLREINPRRFTLQNLRPLLNFNFKSAEVFQAVINSVTNEANLGPIQLGSGDRIFEFRSNHVGWIWVTKSFN
ncbi:hypothetical protein DFA_09628 [Cavenderia fasciculata]|uniref:Uncharacterized protein n=1 Tax=Cavenderia fasciculata TaxID=261658 RepID=F4Q857_CACFS|nr:uncharacterized protein DFA_09628 [Cavenderia fasciculata]EGG15957.1 hypothetical protein DFA_09628 [Cavenderia fasciculata]|eukprot:XP_004352282.1 hypothetical protein DFA_09628 [Cavenderia fasciculata]